MIQRFYQFLVKVFVKPLIKALHEELNLLAKTVGAENTERITKRMDAIEKEKVRIVLDNALSEDVCAVKAQIMKLNAEIKIILQEKQRILDDVNMLRARLNLYERKRHLGEVEPAPAEDVVFEK